MLCLPAPARSFVPVRPPYPRLAGDELRRAGMDQPPTGAPRRPAAPSLQPVVDEQDPERWDGLS